MASETPVKLELWKNIRKLLPYLKDDKVLFFWGLFAMVIVTVLGLLDPLILAHIIDYSIPKHSIQDMYLYAGIYVMVIIASGLVSYLQILTLSKLGIKLITRFKSTVFAHLLKLPVSYFDQNPIGELISRVESDSERVKSLFSDLSIAIIGNLLYFTGVFIVLLIRNWKITIYIVIPVIFTVIAYWYLVRYLSKFYRRARELYAVVTAQLTEFIQAMPVIQLFNRQQYFLNKVSETSQARKKVELRASFLEYSTQGFFILLFEIVFVVVIILMTAPKILAGVMTIGSLIVFIQYISRIIYPLMNLSENAMQVQRSFVSLQRIMDLTTLPSEESSHRGNIIPTFQHTIEFRHVWFAYKEDEWVLRDVNFTIARGEKIALVGASGSGKTTTISLLSGFYPVTKGEILVDGINILELDFASWRKKIGLILQDVFLFPGNILENIRIYNTNISEESVIKAVEMVSATDFVAQLPYGYQTELSERGQNISQGEKQLLSFARAIVFDPEIIIMDEATASIDPQTEAKIQGSMASMLQNKTALIVAHRLTSVLDADQIFLFDAGEIVAKGTHQEMYNNSPEYQRLVDLQFLNTKEEA